MASEKRWRRRLITLFSRNGVCECEEEFRSACYGSADYQYEDKQYCILHFPSQEKENDFRKAVESKLVRKEDFDFSGVYFPVDIAEFTGATFNGRVSFQGATFSDEANFAGAIFSGRANFKEATFSKVAYFEGANFSERTNFERATFSKIASFERATFSKIAYFQGANFSQWAGFEKATFSGLTAFRGAKFHEEADFEGAAFSKSVFLDGAKFGNEAYYTEATFSGDARFGAAKFSDMVYFSEANFSKVADFQQATFTEGAYFDSLKTFPETTLIFTSARVEKPERIYFHTTRLRPSWFIDVDTQKFDFSDVEWFRIPDASEADTDKLQQLKLEDEVENLVKQDIERRQSLRKLAKACRRLMNNAEENRDYPTANEFHYWSMEAVRKECWRRLGLIASLYWALSGYGVRPLRAFTVLIVMSLVFALLYSWPYIEAPYSLQALEGLSDGYWGGPLDYIGYFLRTEMYSLGALARLNPEPKPAPGLFQTLVIIAGILGPLQVALFLLAIRRKVMR